MKTRHRYTLIAAIMIGAVAFTGGATRLTAQQTVGEKVSATADTVKEKVQDAGTTAANKLDQLWRQVDEQRLKNRTRDEIVAWLLMGVVVGSVLGRIMNLGWGKALVLGLLGAFLGGLVVHLTQFDLGLGPVLIRYEDLLCAVIGAVLILLVGRRLLAGKKPKT